MLSREKEKHRQLVNSTIISFPEEYDNLQNCYLELEWLTKEDNNESMLSSEEDNHKLSIFSQIDLNTKIN